MKPKTASEGLFGRGCRGFLVRRKGGSFFRRPIYGVIDPTYTTNIIHHHHYYNRPLFFFRFIFVS